MKTNATEQQENAAANEDALSNPLATSPPARSSTEATIYCYYCGVYHPADVMRLVLTKGGRRWRCITSIKAARATMVERNAFGQRVTEMNYAAAAEARAKRRASLAGADERRL